MTASANHYRVGADFERQVRTNLTADGYEVLRSAGSKTVVDLVAFKPGELVFVQCKRSGRIGPAERAGLVELAGWVNATPLLAARVPAIQGRTRARIAYWRLTGPAAGDRVPWTADRPDETSKS